MLVVVEVVALPILMGLEDLVVQAGAVLEVLEEAEQLQELQTLAVAAAALDQREVLVAQVVQA
jgi:hypothetical protein